MADDLHSIFSDLTAADASALDTRTVIRRARLRRLPAQLGIGAASVLVVVGVVVGGAAGLKGLSSGSTTSSSAGSSAERAPQASTDGGTSPADKLNLCGGALADVAPDSNGLVLTPHFPDAAAGAASVSGTVTLTNTGTARVTGSTASTPAITLSRNGVTVWHSNVAMDSMAAIVDLAPGASMTYRATLVPVECGVADDSALTFRDDLPAAPAGQYQVSAAIDLSVDGSSELVTGPQQTISVK